MSKYALKLEQLVQTDNYGDILVTVQYDGNGPKLVTAAGDSIDSQLKHMLDTVLGLVNLMLSKGIVPLEIADQLETEPRDGQHLPLNDLLAVIATSLREAPEGITQIRPEILLDIAPEMIKEFTENNTEVQNLEPVTKNLPKEDSPSFGALKRKFNQGPATSKDDQKLSEKTPTPTQNPNQNEEKTGFFGNFKKSN